MATINIKTRKQKQVIDITDLVYKEIAKQSNGVCILFLTHTTAALTTADLDPGSDLDMLDAFQVMVPVMKYRHPHNPDHMPDHILSSLIGSSLSIPVRDGKLVLGQWQKIVLIELDGPRDRQIILSFLS
ncbi:MAG: hypothetical protein A3A80_01645 [Candidatus Terrybacteria bacterium RIFCSPLOWO2_01_FULL_44_24]|uniref:Secondary thiamine-phosphate synthase enzyme n=1 Tax=Candidatus Terrybacteria bacterium RIFCSPHIGHO2_01_FULL_43_35 TaxID=1802361 RepID=A0A1G2PFI8_9BACT|nr:MAG: hypothetical protein A2828_04025 [Candidatus Terrybacteria bacterium RIFCSPHIGHO2_01_FULL_43_35]OHA49900.1 MAG: hypothetical protein A3B75_03280 [Candidatus Terrybacteria bacterium RIFCSPHIGHO2_02_FULL_43_14]OHA51779.1 MAG: hypothetical protein A3A80_01645 [Candidatus Terrybacteria bacterium RIFCSPLOWO2_01_FULL_44_24]